MNFYFDPLEQDPIQDMLLAQAKRPQSPPRVAPSDKLPKVEQPPPQPDESKASFLTPQTPATQQQLETQTTEFQLSLGPSQQRESHPIDRSDLHPLSTPSNVGSSLPPPSSQSSQPSAMSNGLSQIITQQSATHLLSHQAHEHNKVLDSDTVYSSSQTRPPFRPPQESPHAPRQKNHFTFTINTESSLASTSSRVVKPHVGSQSEDQLDDRTESVSQGVLLADETNLDMNPERSLLNPIIQLPIHGHQPDPKHTTTDAPPLSPSTSVVSSSGHHRYEVLVHRLDALSEEMKQSKTIHTSELKTMKYKWNKNSMKCMTGFSTTSTTTLPVLVMVVLVVWDCIPFPP
jgi:hypothetical protein